MRNTICARCEQCFLSSDIFYPIWNQQKPIRQECNKCKLTGNVIYLHSQCTLTDNEYKKLIIEKTL